MSTAILILLMAGAFGLQSWLDRRRIAAHAARARWRDVRVREAPLARWHLRTRWQRCYRLRYRDERGREERRLCIVSPAGLDLETPSARRNPIVALGRLGPLGFVVAATLAGGFLGMALGIGGSLLVAPSSNILPAYGILVGAPIGLVGGLALGLWRRPRRGERAADRL